MTSFLLCCFSASSMEARAFSLYRAAERSSLSLDFSFSTWIYLNSLSAALWLINSRFLSRLRMNFWRSASLSDSISLAHWVLSISCSRSFFSLSIWTSCCLESVYQVRILTVSETFFLFSIASLFSLSTFFCWSSIHSLAYTCSSTIYCSSLAFLSMSCFSRSIWVPAIMKLVSSLLRSSVSILNFLSRACWTDYCLSASRWSLSVSSLYYILALTCSGVSRLAMNSCSYY